MTRHIDRSFLSSFANGEVSREDATRRLMDHLSRVCPECHLALAEFVEAMGLEDLQGQRSLPGTTLLRALERDRVTREKEARVVADRLEDAGDEAPRRVREGKVVTYADPILAEILLSRTWQACERRQPDARALALATFEVGQKMSHLGHLCELSFDYRFAGLTLAANAARIAQDFEAAFDLLEKAETYMFEVADPALESDFHRVRGHTCLDAGEIDEAEASAARARHNAAECADNPRRVQAHLLVAKVRRARGDLRGQLAALDEADGCVDPMESGSSEQFHFVIRVNRATAWLDLGDADKAEDELDRIDREGFSKFGQEGKLPWIRGRVAASRGDHSTATVELRAAHRAFLESGSLVEAAHVLIDLAKSSRRASKLEEVAEAETELVRLNDLVGDRIAANQVKGAISSYLRDVA